MTSLAPIDWILAALSALAEGGIDAVKVERLARVLKTSKGSFYWHFTDRQALLDALLDFWEAEGTTDVIAELAPIIDPAERLRGVAAIAMAATTRGIDVARAEAALRSWASQDEAVALRLQRVERDRVAFLMAELDRLGYGAKESERLAKGLYMALLGLYGARRYAPDLADDRAIFALIETIISGAVTPASRKGDAATSGLAGCS